MTTQVSPLATTATPHSNTATTSSADAAAFSQGAANENVHGSGGHLTEDDPLGLHGLLAGLEGEIKSLFHDELNQHAREINQDVAQLQYEVNKANETAEMEHEKVLAGLKRRADVMEAFTTHVSPYLGAADN